MLFLTIFFFFFQAEDGIRDPLVTGVQTCALPISRSLRCRGRRSRPASRRPHRRGALVRSEERRVGKECRSRWGRDHYKKKDRKRRVTKTDIRNRHNSCKKNCNKQNDE